MALCLILELIQIKKGNKMHFFRLFYFPFLGLIATDLVLLVEMNKYKLYPDILDNNIHCTFVAKRSNIADELRKLRMLIDFNVLIMSNYINDYINDSRMFFFFCTVKSQTQMTRT